MYGNLLVMAVIRTFSIGFLSDLLVDDSCELVIFLDLESLSDSHFATDFTIESSFLK